MPCKLLDYFAGGIKMQAGVEITFGNLGRLCKNVTPYLILVRCVFQEMRGAN